MKESTIIIDDRAIARGQVESVLETLLREGARRLLQEALGVEVEEYSRRFQALRDDQGQRLVVRNGYHPERELVTGVGKVPVRQPRVHDRRPGEHFTSAILPPYLRRTPSIDALIPLLYLKGISTNAFPDALRAILGDGVVGLSPTNIVRLKQVWEQEFAAWGQRDLHGQRYVYLWADALYFNVRLEKDRPCVLVVIGATADGHKQLLAIQDGERGERPQLAASAAGPEGPGPHRPRLPGRRRRRPGLLEGGGGGLPRGPRSAVLGAQDGQRPGQAAQADPVPTPRACSTRCNLADTRKHAEDACDRFRKLYGARHPKAAECLEKDRDVLFTFYDFPAAHWRHLRTTNPIESTFATVRHRTRQTRGCGSRITTLTMVFKLAIEAERHWRRLNGHQLITHCHRRRHLRRWRTATQRGRLTPHGYPGCALFRGPRHTVHGALPSTTFDSSSSKPIHARFGSAPHRP